MAVEGDLYYDTIQDFVSWVSDNFAGIVSNDDPNSFDISSEEVQQRIMDALLNAEGEVDGYLRKRGYVVPIPSSYARSHNVIRMYVRNIAIYELYGRRGVTKQRYYKYTKTMDNLKQFSDGDKLLPEDVPFVNNDERIAHGNNLESVFSESSKITRHSL